MPQGVAERTLVPVPGLATGLVINSAVFLLGLPVLLKGKPSSRISSPHVLTTLSLD